MAKTKETGSLSEKMSKSADKRLAEESAIQGFLQIEHVRDGEVIATIETPNYVVDAGLAEVAALISTSGGGSLFSAIAIGTDDSATAATQTQLIAVKIQQPLLRHSTLLVRSLSRKQAFSMKLKQMEICFRGEHSLL